MTVDSMQAGLPPRPVEQYSMPIDYEFDSQQKLVRTRMWGNLVTEDFIRQIKRMGADPQLSQPLRELVDTSEVTDVQVRQDVGFMQALQTLCEESGLFDGARVAFYTPSDLTYGMTRMFALMVEASDAPFVYRPFRDLEQARAWLAEADVPAARGDEALTGTE